MFKLWRPVLILIFFNGYGFAQKANFKRALKYSDLYRHFNGNSLGVYPHFINKGDKFWYSFRTDEGWNYYLVDPANKSKEYLFNKDRITEQLTFETGELCNRNTLKLENIKFLNNDKIFTFEYKKGHYVYDRSKHRLTKRKTVVGRLKFPSYAEVSPDSNWMVYALNHNLYLQKSGDTLKIRLTEDGERYYSYASEGGEQKTSPVKCIARWFEDSKKIFFIRYDERKVKEMFLLDYLKTPRPQVVSYKYEIPGSLYVAQPRIGIIDISTRKLTWIKAEHWQDQWVLCYLHLLQNSSKLYFQRINRRYNEQEICVADTETGDVRVLIRDKTQPYISPWNSYFTVINGGEEMIFWSERTGNGHYYLYDREGNLKNRITSGNWTAGAIHRIDTSRREIYMSAYGKEKGVSPYYSMEYKVSLDKTNAMKLLTPENATHNVFFSRNNRYFVDNFSRVDKEPHIVLRDKAGNILMELEKVDLRRLYESGWRKPERFTVKAADGITDLYGVIYKPEDFDSTKKYPVIEYVYPGPQTEGMDVGFTINSVVSNNACPLAQLGFIVISMGHRGGNPIRDKCYSSFGYGKLRDYPLADHKYGLEQLASRFSYMDISRVGIFGYSGGGFMAVTALCKYPDFYKAAVSGAGNHDNNIFNRLWSEIHHGVKVEKGSKDCDSVFSCNVPTNMDLVYRMKGHLLLMAGGMDDNVHPASTYRLVNALVNAGKKFDLMIFPQQGHVQSGQALKFAERYLWFHFAKYLLEDYSCEKFYNIDKFIGD